jgi:hypothetical protein
MRPYAPTRYGKTCDGCGTAITVGRGEPALCDDCRSRESAARRDTRR